MCGIIVGTVGKIVSMLTTSRAMFYRVIFRFSGRRCYGYVAQP